MFSSFRQIDGLRIDNKSPTGKGRFCFFVCKWVKGLLNRTLYFSEFIILARTKSPSVEGGTGTLSWLSLLMSLLKTLCLKHGVSPPGKSDLGCLRCPFTVTGALQRVFAPQTDHTVWASLPRPLWPAALLVTSCCSPARMPSHGSP